MSSSDVVVSREGQVQTIRLDRKQKKNAVTRAMYAAMTEALRSGDADANIRAHVFLGVPGAFCAGNDLADFLAVAEGGDPGVEVWDFLLALAGASKPVLSGVDGIAVGIGTTLNLHCDLTFATPRTVFRTPFVDLGLVPEAASSLILPALAGRQQAFATLCLGEPLTAEDALRLGLIHRVVAEDALEEAVMAAARKVAAKPVEAMRVARDLVGGPRDPVLARIREEADRFRERLRSDEARQALQAFFARAKG